MRIRDPLVRAITTFFYLGYLPFIPGTFGSIAGLCIFFLVKDCVFAYAAVTVSLTLLGYLLSGRAEEVFRKKDHRSIIIDEVCGMLISLSFLRYDPKLVVIGFFIFRLLDTVKPYPADRLQDLKGGAGVMSDDIVAGLYTSLILHGVAKLASFTAS
jgi:phosphatidylglycerophosphatase A